MIDVGVGKAPFGPAEPPSRRDGGICVCEVWLSTCF